MGIVKMILVQWVKTGVLAQLYFIQWRNLDSHTAAYSCTVAQSLTRPLFKKLLAFGPQPDNTKNNTLPSFELITSF